MKDQSFSAMQTTVYIETSGCAFNASDSEVMAGVLANAGHRIVESADEAEVVILNTCTVKDRTFFNFRRRLDQLMEAPEGGRRVIVAGCIPKAHRRSDLFDRVSTLGPDTIDRVDEVVRETLAGRAVHCLDAQEKPDRPTLPVLRRNPVVEILPIARGCLSACTFCQTRLARGRLHSFNPRQIIAQARRALDEGVRELWVTGQDTGAYGRDIGTSLPELLWKLAELEGDFRVRLGMTSPQWVTEQLSDYLDVLAHPKMFRFFHVPVQSGSDRVLRAMKREGTVGEFETIAAAFADRFPDATFLTDLIVGYPTETEEDFELTLELADRLRLPGTNISKFSARPGTPAERLAGHHSSVISERSKRLTEVVRRRARAYHRAWVGRTCEALIDQIDERDRRLGRTDAYRTVQFESDLPLGATARVEITGSSTFSLAGREVQPAAGAA